MLPAKGSRYYLFGRHYEIVGHGLKDGEPAVYLKDVQTRKRVKVPVMWRLAERKAIPCST